MASGRDDERASDSPAVGARAPRSDRKRRCDRVDVRTEEERAVVRIDGSRLLDHAYHDALLQRDRDKPIVFKCNHGVRSQCGAEHFRQHGFRNLDIWRASSTPRRCSWIRLCRATERRVCLR
jgi:rhodanese-related sulfurtransferase